jgi:hypothetical protein
MGRMRPTRLLVALGAAAALSACGGKHRAADAGASDARGPDAGLDAPAGDAGGPDLGAPDTGAGDRGVDAPAMEVGPGDAGADGAPDLGPCPSTCGTTCCRGATVCLAGACVTPGPACAKASDCPAGQYCETALGANGDAGAGGGDAGAGCVTAPALAGRCLDLPALDCSTDGGAPDGGCTCEYHPAPGPLAAVARWTWGPATASARPTYTDVWSTPAAGRLHDSNCDGVVDERDPPAIVFVSGHSVSSTTGLGTSCQGATTGSTTMCHAGALRMLDGARGTEIWTLAKASATSVGFAGISVALGDVDGDGRMDILAVTGEGFVVMLDGDGNVVRTSDKPIPGNANAAFGWGGGLAIADMDGDGHPEIAYGATVYTTMGGAITQKFVGTMGTGGGGVEEQLSAFADLDGAADGHLELVAGNTAYRADGVPLWTRATLADGFNAVADLDGDGKPEVALVAGGQLTILDGPSGTTVLGPKALPGTGSGGPPVIADFDGDGRPEIAVAMGSAYAMVKPDFAGGELQVVWQVLNHQLSSSVPGAVAFDFEGDGKASLLVADECFFWILYGPDGSVRYSAPRTAFTGTGSPLVADLDGDGHADALLIANGVDPSRAGWACLDAANQPVTVNGVTWTPSTLPDKAYRGLVAFADAASAWPRARTLWNEHTYHVTNVCDGHDDACAAPNVYGAIPPVEKKSWTTPWANSFRQNAAEAGRLDAPDPVVSLAATCTTPVQLTASVRNIGSAVLPAGAPVRFYAVVTGARADVGRATTTHALGPGHTEALTVAADPTVSGVDSTFVATMDLVLPVPLYRECRSDNDTSGEVKACP